MGEDSLSSMSILDVLESRQKMLFEDVPLETTGEELTAVCSAKLFKLTSTNMVPADSEAESSTQPQATQMEEWHKWHLSKEMLRSESGTNSTHDLEANDSTNCKKEK